MQGTLRLLSVRQIWSLQHTGCCVILSTQVGFWSEHGQSICSAVRQALGVSVQSDMLSVGLACFQLDSGRLSVGLVGFQTGWLSTFGRLLAAASTLGVLTCSTASGSPGSKRRSSMYTPRPLLPLKTCLHATTSSVSSPPLLLHSKSMLHRRAGRHRSTLTLVLGLHYWTEPHTACVTECEFVIQP